MSEKFTPGLPWAYRPQERDDWGIIRNSEGWIVGRARHYVCETELDEHRKKGTDPYAEDGRKMAAAQAMYDALCKIVEGPITVGASAVVEGPITIGASAEIVSAVADLMDLLRDIAHPALAKARGEL